MDTRRNFTVADLLTVEGRKEALAEIALAGLNGVENEKMNMKTGAPSPCLEHDLGSAVRAIGLLHQIDKETEASSSNYTITIVTEQ